MEPAKFKVGNNVKFIDDADAMAGKVLSIGYTSEEGYTYKISSRHFDAAINDMVEGYKICREEELVAVKTK